MDLEVLMVPGGQTAQTAMDVVVVVTYIGLNESGCPFFGAMVGTLPIITSPVVPLMVRTR